VVTNILETSVNALV